MYFWNITRLKADLRAAPLPSREVLRYGLAYIAIWAVGWLLPQGDAAQKFEPGPALLWVLVGTTAVGLWVAYQANGGAAGTDLAARILSLFWVIGIRLMAGCMIVGTLLLLAFLAYAYALHGAPDLDPRRAMVALIGFVFVTQVIGYWRLARHLADLR
jgi:uncharacterized membrane-anchored protein YitT (DUF2179 family)